VLIKALKLLLKAKFVFCSPKNYNLLIFDDASIEELKNVLINYDYFILETRVERIKKIYLSLKIIFLCFKNYRGNILSAYLLSLIDIIHPKVVFTFIDNSYKFSELAKLRHAKYKFVALQNGARYEHKTFRYLFQKKIIGHDFDKFYIPYFLCFGQHEINEYKKNNIKVKNFFKVGSLRTSNFLHLAKKKRITKKLLYDICLISEPYAWDKILNKANLPFEEGIAKLLRFVIKFSIKNDLKLIIASRQGMLIDGHLTTEQKKNNPEFAKEHDFYKKYLTNNELDYLLKRFFIRREKFHSYKLMSQSKVVVSTMSTMLRENLFMKGKILACNFTPTNIFNFPIKGICSIKNCSFKDFEKRLLYILSISKKEFFSKLQKNSSYVIENNNNYSTINTVKKRLDLLLKK